LRGQSCRTGQPNPAWTTKRLWGGDKKKKEGRGKGGGEWKRSQCRKGEGKIKNEPGGKGGGWKERKGVNQVRLDSPGKNPRKSPGQGDQVGGKVRKTKIIHQSPGEGKRTETKEWNTRTDSSTKKDGHTKKKTGIKKEQTRRFQPISTRKDVQVKEGGEGRVGAGE